MDLLLFQSWMSSTLLQALIYDISKCNPISLRLSVSCLSLKALLLLGYTAALVSDSRSMYRMYFYRGYLQASFWNFYSTDSLFWRISSTGGRVCCLMDTTESNSWSQDSKSFLRRFQKPGMNSNRTTWALGAYFFSSGGSAENSSSPFIIKPVKVDQILSARLARTETKHKQEHKYQKSSSQRGLTNHQKGFLNCLLALVLRITSLQVSLQMPRTGCSKFLFGSSWTPLSGKFRHCLLLCRDLSSISSVFNFWQAGDVHQMYFRACLPALKNLGLFLLKLPSDGCPDLCVRRSIDMQWTLDLYRA